MKKYLFTDLDRTLLFDQKDETYDLNHEDLNALRLAANYDIEIIAASGRAQNAAQFLIRRIGYPIDMIALNGAEISCNGTNTLLTGLPLSDYVKISEDVNKKFAKVAIGTLDYDGTYYLKEPYCNEYIYRLTRHQLTGAENPIRSDIELKNNREECQLPKILFYVKKTEDSLFFLSYLKKTYGSVYHFLFSNDAIIECIPKEVNKAVGIQKYMKMRNIYSQQCWAAGDSDNDIEMLKMFKNSCCMEHGTKLAKEAATYVVKNITEVIEKMIN